MVAFNALNMRNFIFIVILFFSTFTLAENYNGVWERIGKSCYGLGWFDDIMKNNINVTGNTVTLGPHFGKLRKSLTGKRSIGMNIDNWGHFRAKIKGNELHGKFTPTFESDSWNKIKKCTFKYAKKNSSNNLDKQITETKAKKIKTTPGISKGSQEDLIVNVGDRVFFGYDSADLDTDAQELLQDQAAWLNQNRDVSVTIEGHTDERSTFNFSLAIGEKRAQAVKNYLIGLGIDPQRISTVSYGKSRPAIIGSNDGAWAQNRRAVTIVN